MFGICIKWNTVIIHSYNKPFTFNKAIEIDPILLEKPTITQISESYIHIEVHEKIMKAINLPASTKIELA